MPGDRGGACEGGPKILPSHRSGKSYEYWFVVYIVIYLLNRTILSKLATKTHIIRIEMNYLVYYLLRCSAFI